MPDQFFVEQYKQKAREESALAQAGRGREFDPVGFLNVIREILDLVDLDKQSCLLDIGCANGLLDIVLSGLCQRLVAIEPIQELAALAEKNLRGCSNVEVMVGHGAEIPCQSRSINRVLMLEVIQLIPRVEVEACFREIRRVVNQGRVVIGAIPHRAHQDRFLRSYLKGVREASHLSESLKQEIIERNERANWFDPNELVEMWQGLGGCAREVKPSLMHPNADHRFHLVVELPKY